MARQTLTPQPFTKTALLNPTYQSLTGFTGVQWQNTGREVLAVINGATASTATLNIGSTIEGQAVTPFTVVLPTNNTVPQFLAPLDHYFTQPDGNIYVDLSSVATVTVALLQLPGAA